MAVYPALFLVADTRLHLAVSVGTSVGRYVGHIFEFRAVFALLLLPNRPRLDCRVSGLVLFSCGCTQLYTKLCPSLGRWVGGFVRPLVRGSVGLWVRRPVGPWVR